MDANALPIEGLLAGQSALVTGSGRGIGRGVALLLARAGAGVCVADLNGADAEKVAAEIVAAGGRAIAAQADVSNEPGRIAMVEAAERAHGPLDVLVNNAGVNQVVSPFDMTEADWDRVILFLASPLAQYVTGQSINIDGGWVTY